MQYSKCVIDESKIKLINIIKMVGRKSSIVFEDDLISFIGLTINMNELKECGVQNIYSLNPNSKFNLDGEIIIIAKSNLDSVDKIINFISNQKLKNVHYYIIFIPEISTLCKLALENNAVFSQIRFIMSLPIYFLPLYDDLFIFNSTPNYFLMKGLYYFQALCGDSYFKGIGKNADIIIDELDDIRTSKPLSKIIDNEFILFDRNLDILTPLCMQLTYAGLIDENLGIKMKSIEIKSNNKIHLNDPIYKRTKNKLFTELAPMLSKDIHTIQLTYKDVQKIKESDETTLEDFQTMREAIKGATIATHIETHLGIIKKISDIINNDEWRNQYALEKKILENEKLTIHDINEILNINDLNKILRFICIRSIINKGLDEHYEYILSKIINKFGYDKIRMLKNLSDIKLLSRYCDLNLNCNVIDTEYDVSKNLFMG